MRVSFAPLMLRQLMRVAGYICCASACVRTCFSARERPKCKVRVKRSLWLQLLRFASREFVLRLCNTRNSVLPRKRFGTVLRLPGELDCGPYKRMLNRAYNLLTASNKAVTGRLSVRWCKCRFVTTLSLSALRA